MNSTTIESQAQAQAQAETQNMGGLSYGLGLSLGVLFFIITLTYVSYLCNRSHLSATAPAVATTTTSATSTSTTEHGLDEAALRHYPTLIYRRSGSTAAATSGCSICLADYKESAVLRLLPECGHAFHRRCIDPWLRLNPTCPICRNSPVPTPAETPAARVMPLRALQN